MIKVVPISSVKENPGNPRIIKDDKFKKLVKSIQEFPQMLEIRPIVVNDEMVILGGNMRLKACKEAGLKKIPIIKASSLTPEQQKEFIIKDNINFGSWEWESLANEWNQESLLNWGFEPWQFGDIEYNSEPPTVVQNIEELEKIKEQRRVGNESVVEKTDTEKYLVIVFSTRDEKQALLKELGLPEDERYIPSGGVQIIPSGSWISKFKSAAKNKSGATG